MSWDPFQRAVLAELGHAVYMPAGAIARAETGPADNAADPAMLARLARAAGVDADILRAQADIAACSGSLRGDPAAKRALWPRLRALRRQQR